MPQREPRMSLQTLRVMKAVMATRDELCGAQIAKATSISSGTLYPILVRLERAEWLTSRWETGNPKSLARPRRRFYQVTERGFMNADYALWQLRPQWIF